MAQLNLAAEKSSAENEKNALLQQKAEAEKAAAAAAAPFPEWSGCRRRGWRGLPGDFPS